MDVESHERLAFLRLDGLEEGALDLEATAPYLLVGGLLRVLLEDLGGIRREGGRQAGPYVLPGPLVLLRVPALRGDADPVAGVVPAVLSKQIDEHLRNLVMIMVYGGIYVSV